MTDHSISSLTPRPVVDLETASRSAIINEVCCLVLAGRESASEIAQAARGREVGADELANAQEGDR
jgi:hypothetical protein